MSPTHGTSVEANSSEENILMVINVSQSENSWPCAFQCLINGIFLFAKKNCDLYKYADDNTLPKSGTSLVAVTKSLEDGKSLISWFSSNKMQANTEQFQAIAMGNKTHKQNIAFNVKGTNIKCEEEVKLLGVKIDFKLDYNTNISNICIKKRKKKSCTST